jgi:hypothetical protein
VSAKDLMTVLLNPQFAAYGCHLMKKVIAGEALSDQEKEGLQILHDSIWKAGIEYARGPVSKRKR